MNIKANFKWEFFFVLRFIFVNSFEECSDIKFLDESRRTPTRTELLKKICNVGVEHVDLDNTQKQFSIFVLVRDSFASDVNWIPGDAQDVINTASWIVNDVTKLSISKYHWYKYAYPMWPLPYQAMPLEYSPEKDSKQKWWNVFKKKDQDWPNYGIATPVYFASNSWRNQMWALEEYMQEEEKKHHDRKIDNTLPKSYLLNPAKFKVIGKDLLEKVNPLKVESYSSWPFLDYSLIAMVQSSVRRNKGLCPDDLYIFFRYTPCHPQENSEISCSSAAMRATTLLTQAQCRTTNVIVGYSQEYEGNAL